MRLTRLLAPLAIAASLALPHAGAGAVQTLVFTFPVLCDDPNGTASNELADITLPSGTYAVAIAGVCTSPGLGYGTGTGTPCDVLGTPIPCAGVSAGNLPNALCNTSTGGVRTACNPLPTVELTGCSFYSVTVAGDCVSTPQAGLVHHDGGVMTAQFNDSIYNDNTGVLLVTVVWTPL